MIFIVAFALLNALFLGAAWIFLLVMFINAVREKRRNACWITGIPLALLSVTGLYIAVKIGGR